MRRFTGMLEGVYSASRNKTLLFSNTLKNIPGKRRMDERLVISMGGLVHAWGRVVDGTQRVDDPQSNRRR